MRIAIKIYDRVTPKEIQVNKPLKLGNVTWFNGVPYKITVQNIENRKIPTVKRKIEVIYAND